MDMQGSATEQPTSVQNPTAVTKPGPMVEQAAVPNPSVNLPSTPNSQPSSNNVSPAAASPSVSATSSGSGGGAVMKIFLIIIVLLAIGIGVYLFMTRGKQLSSSTSAVKPEQQVVVSPVPSTAPVDEFSTDTKNIDNILSTLDDESGSADLGLNDKQTDLSSN